VKTPAIARALPKKVVPVMDLYGSLPQLGFPNIKSSP
jgi:hypothetical protein